MQDFDRIHFIQIKNIVAILYEKAFFPLVVKFPTQVGEIRKKLNNFFEHHIQSVRILFAPELLVPIIKNLNSVGNGFFSLNYLFSH